MYFQILKRDLKRKKTMNLILLIFILLAVTFVASSVNNMTCVTMALDRYLEKAGKPDYCFAMSDKKEEDKFREFARERHYDYRCLEMLQVDPQDVEIDGKVFDYSNTTCISGLKNSIKVFNQEDREITDIPQGEIYVTAGLFYSEKYHFKEGSILRISAGDKTREFKLKGCTKDAIFGSDMFGMTRMLVSEEDFSYLCDASSSIIYFNNVYTTSEDFKDKFEELTLNTIFFMDGSVIKQMYLMDILVAAVILIVSICLILISMVMLHFMIRFTISEEFREIGVMKAVGLPVWRIRGLYITKYFMIALIGTVIGFFISIPFGNIMLENASRNIMLSGSSVWLNLLCAVLTGMTVVGFCYLCTRRVRSLSPVDAIRKGENGERFARKGIFSLNRGRLSPVPFMAVNDISSGFRKFFSMICIFALGILLIIIPVNSINTLQSDNLITWFNSAHCDHVLEKETIFNKQENNKEMLEQNLKGIKETLKREDIPAEVFREVLFRMNICCRNKRMLSLAFIGTGDVTAEQYTYLEGTAPQKAGEVAITGVVAEDIGASVGDDVQITYGEHTKTYTVTAINQSMNNMGEGIRFYQEEDLDFAYAVGSFGVQIKYQDEPGEGEKERRLQFLKDKYRDYKAYTAGDYINQMMGDVAGQMDDVRQFIVIVVLVINILVTVLMVRSFITREKGEIGMMKAIGFSNGSLMMWQSFRIGIVLVLAAVIAELISNPLSQLTVGYVFKMMGAQRIEFEIKPLEVYVMYPLLVLAVTTVTGMLASLQIRRISPAETSNIE